MTEALRVLHQRSDQTLEEAFPECAPLATPLGERVLIQLRSTKKRTAGGIYMPDTVQDQESWMTSIGKVIALGPLAYKDRENPANPWPEGAWVAVGDYVRCPKWGGDRWTVPLTAARHERDEVARFVIVRDKEIIAKITGDPLSFIDYI